MSARKIDTVESIPQKNSIDSEWIVWHKALKADFGKKQANLLFLQAWKERNQDGLITDGLANTVVMREYLEKQGIKVEKGYLSYVADVADDTMDMFSGIMGTARTGAIVVSAVIFILLIWIVIKIVKNPSPYVHAFTAVASRGMVK